MNIEIANRLVELRRKKGLSQEELADLLGVSRQAVSKWERAEASPDTDNLICLAKIYGVSLDELLGIHVEKESKEKEPKEKEATIDIDDQEAHVHVQGKVNVNDGAGNEVNIGKNGVHIKSKERGELHIGLGGINIQTNGEKRSGRSCCDKDKSYHVSIKKKHTVFHVLKCIFDAATPFLCLIAYILMGFFLPNSIGWSQTWIVFLLIPIVPSIFSAIENRAFCTFCYPVFITGIYLILGMVYGLWHPYWFLFITIPVYYVVFAPIDKAIQRSILKCRFKKQSIDVEVEETENFDEDEE